MAVSTPALIVTGIEPGRPDNTLPPSGGGGYIDNSLPPPPGLWPPPVEIWPPIALPPGYPMPPGSIWPPVHPGGPPVIGGGPAPPQPGQPTPPERPTPGLPPVVGGGPVLPSTKYLVAIVAASAAGGLKVIGYTVVDPSLSVGLPLPGGPPGHIDHTLPPTEPTPRR